MNSGAIMCDVRQGPWALKMLDQTRSRTIRTAPAANPETAAAAQSVRPENGLRKVRRASISPPSALERSTGRPSGDGWSRRATEAYCAGCPGCPKQSRRSCTTVNAGLQGSQPGVACPMRARSIRVEQREQPVLHAAADAVGEPGEQVQRHVRPERLEFA